MDQAILEKEALLLPPAQRALLADVLLASLDAGPEREIDVAWAKVAEERLAAFRRGQEAMLDGPTVLAELRSRCQS